MFTWLVDKFGIFTPVQKAHGSLYFKARLDPSNYRPVTLTMDFDGQRCRAELPCNTIPSAKFCAEKIINAWGFIPIEANEMEN